MRAAADAAPGPLSALAACLATFASRALHERRLAWAVIAEPVDADIDALRLEFRRALAAELERASERPSRAAICRIRTPASPRLQFWARCWKGCSGRWRRLPADAGAAREAVQTITLLALRSLGVVDARARGLVAQCVLP